MGKNESRAITLTDSLIDVGWSDVAGLQFATVAATVAGEPEKALQFLYYNFRTNGRVDIFSHAKSAEQAEFEYKSKRDMIIRQIDAKK